MTEKRTPTSHPIRELLTFWDSRYQEAHHHRYPFSGGKDSKMMKDLREFYSDEQIRSFMAAFFEMEDPFIEQSGHSLGVFRGCLPKVIQHLQRGTAKAKPDEYGHLPPCRTRHECLEKLLADSRAQRAAKVEGV
jgi:hypothetical protein